MIPTRVKQIVDLETKIGALEPKIDAHCQKSML